MAKPTKKAPPKPKEPTTKPELPTLAFASAKALDAWLARHHATAAGVWLELAKKATKVPSVTYPEAVELALVYGWIDGQKRPLDDTAWLQKLTPRGARSIWSKINCTKALALIEAGRMHAAGRAEVARAQADGRWDKAYDSPKTAQVPEDLARALAANPRAAAAFAALDGRNRYAILWRVQTAKRPETRARRIADLVALIARGEKLH